MAKRICSIPDCEKQHYGRGWCHTHYMQWFRSEDREATTPKRKPPHCTVYGCEKPVKGNGLCPGHWQRNRRYGSPTGKPERIEPKPCQVEGCDKPSRARGLCPTHYRRWRIHGDPSVSLLNREHDGTCTVEGCSLPYHSNGYCDRHAQRVRSNGDVNRISDLSLEARFWSLVVEDENGCWIWQGATDRDGYGTFSLGRSRPVRAHRWAYEHMVAPIPEGLHIDHLCFVTGCVNPYHLDPVTAAVNNARRDARARASE